MHKEVEIKARLQNPEKTLNLLREFGIEFTKEIHQEDKIYSPKDLQNFTHFQPGVNFLRVRRQDGVSFLTLKKSEKNELESTEIETEVSNPGAVENLLKEIGYSLSVEVTKLRRKSKYQDMEICLDEVKGLGSFIEIEKIAEIGTDVEKIQEELFQFLTKFGVTESDRVKQGYDTLVAISKGIS